MGMVEVGGTLAGELEMLGLVLADRDMSGTMDEHIGSLQDRIGEEAELEAGTSLFIRQRHVVLELEFALGTRSQKESERGGQDKTGHERVHLPLGHARQVPNRCRAAQQPHEFGVGGHGGLVEQHASLRVEADGQQGRQHLAAALA